MTATPLEGRWTVHRTQEGYADLELFWTDHTNWRRWFATSVLRGLPGGATTPGAEAPVAFRIEQDAGQFEFEGTLGDGRGTGTFRFRPDRAFVATLRAAGVQDVGEVTDHQLKNLAYGLISAAALREFAALGLAPLTLDDAIGLGIRQITPAYVRALQALEVDDARTVAGVVDLRMGGVTPELVEGFRAVGLRALTGRELVDLRRGRVTPGFVRSVREAGYRDVSPATLIEMRRRGIDETARREGLRRGG